MALQLRVSEIVAVAGAMTTLDTLGSEFSTVTLVLLLTVSPSESLAVAAQTMLSPTLLLLLLKVKVAPVATETPPIDQS